MPFILQKPGGVAAGYLFKPFFYAAEKLSFPPPLPLSASRVHQQCDYNRLISMIFGAFFFFFQEKVLHNVMSIFTFMGASVVRQDDSYSFEVITKTLDTVIPALIQVCVVCLNCIYFQLCV